MICMANISFKPQVILLSTFLPNISNKYFVIKPNDVKPNFFEDCNSLIHHWLHHL